MIITLLDTETRRKRIVSSGYFPEHWKEGEGAWDNERMTHFGFTPVKGQEKERRAERFLIVKVENEALNLGAWNKNYSPDVMRKAFIC